MKLGQLNAAIRDRDTVWIRFNAGGAGWLDIAVQKRSVLDALKDRFAADGRGIETGLMLSDAGFLARETP